MGEPAASKRAKRGQDSLLGGTGGGGGPDLISRLPDDVLGGIVTLLPTKDGALSVLDLRWQTEFPSETACRLEFPRLKQLTLAYVDISESTLHGILSRCPLLESLLLDGLMGCRRLRISSPTLRSLGVTVGETLREASVLGGQVIWEGSLEELIIVDAPLLVKCISNE